MGTDAKSVVPIPDKPPSTAEEHYARNQYNIDLPQTLKEAIDDDDWIRLTEFQSAFHSETLPLAEFNAKFISKD
jgi:hypothetical protein